MDTLLKNSCSSYDSCFLTIARELVDTILVRHGLPLNGDCVSRTMAGGDVTLAASRATAWSCGTPQEKHQNERSNSFAAI